MSSAIFKRLEDCNIGMSTRNPEDYSFFMSVREANEVTNKITKLKADNERLNDFASLFASCPCCFEFKVCKDVFLPELTHFIPMQDPGLVAQYILEPDH